MPEVSLDELVNKLNTELRIDEIQDAPNAVNGLQMRNDGTVTRVAAAVDASERTIRDAIAQKADLLFVHHGMLWGGLQPITGVLHRKISLCLVNSLAIYSAHLPLDAHPTMGNNAVLAQRLGLWDCKPVLAMFDTPLGFRGNVDSQSREEFHETIRKVMGAEVHLAPGGPEEVRDVVVLSGSSGDQVGKVAAMGADTYVAGEGPHWSYTLAEELGVNLFYAGHYATETFGVVELAKYVESQFGLPWSFIHQPTGL